MQEIQVLIYIKYFCISDELTGSVEKYKKYLTELA